jgi:protease-4
MPHCHGPIPRRRSARGAAPRPRPEPPARSAPVARRSWYVVAWFALLVLQGAARAQEADVGAESTPGTVWRWGHVGSPALAPSPSVARSTDNGAWSLRTNPGGLAYVQGIESSAATVVGSSGRPAFGWYTAFGTGSGFGVGVGADWLDTAWATTSTRWGLAFGGERAGLGVTRIHWRGIRDAPTRDVSSTDLGLQLRATRWLAFGATVENLEGQRAGRVLDGRTWTPSLTVRHPRGVVELDVAASVNEVEPAPLLRATALAHLPGARLFVSGAWSAADIAPTAHASGFQVQTGAEWVLGPSSVGGGMILDGDGIGRSYVSTRLHVPVLATPGSARDTLLRIDLAGEIPERAGATWFGDDGTTFVETIDQLRELSREGTMAGVYLSLGGIQTGAAQLWELRQALDAVRASGRWVVVYLQQATFRDLYLAGSADVVIVAPNVQVLSGGLRAERWYIGDLLERIGVQAQFVRIGPWKSAVERFTRSGPSDEANEDLDRFLDTAWHTMIAGIGTRASLTRERIEEAFAELPLLPADLVALGIADEEGWNEDVPAILQRRLGRRLRASRMWAPDAVRRTEYFPEMRVAVVYIEGSIVDGRGGFSLLSGTRTTGNVEIEQACEAIAGRSDIDAVLVRVNSNGGSALASDRMVHALRRLAARRPVVVSFANVAASGGYYVAALDAPIYAAPNTLTGSIGIYAGAVSIDTLMARIGVTFDRRPRGGPTDLFGIRPWEDADRAVAQRSMEAAYERFLSWVANARSMTRDDVDAVAQGHIWSGLAARENGLIDEVTGLPGALDALRTRAGKRPDTRVQFLSYPDRSLFRLAAGGLQIARVQTEREPHWIASLPSVEPLLRLVEPLLAAEGRPLAHLPVWVDGY